MSGRYPLAPQGVFLTAQGEGVLFGTPMVFVRLAGCSIGCPECDTDYRVASRATAEEIARFAVEAGPACDWVWLTGGEPTDHDLAPLVKELHRAGFRVALATSGVREVHSGWATGGVDFLSVSPHDPARWVQRRGDQVNLVPGLGGLRLEDVEPLLADTCFSHRFVTPLWYAPSGRAEKVRECWEWVRAHPGWRLGVQAHKGWEMP